MQLFNGQNYVAGYQGYGYAGGSAVPSTNTYEKEVVFGGEQKLRQVLASTLEIMDGDLFVVLSGCASEIIGDDVGSIITDFRGALESEGRAIAFAETGGFKGNAYYGYDRVFESLATQIVLPAKRQLQTVNLLGVVPSQDLFWQGNLEELSRLLGRLGLKVNTFLTGRQGLETVRQSSGAALNVILSPYLAEGAAKLYEDRFGVPSLRFSSVPIGPTATAEFLRQIAQRLEIADATLAKVTEKENAYAYEYYDKSSLVITGFSIQHRLAIIGDAATVIGIAKFLVNDFSQLPAIAVITDEPPVEVRDQITRELTTFEYGDPPEVVFAPDLWTVHAAVRKVSPTIVLGSSLDKDLAQELGVQHKTVSFPATDRLILNRAYAGYRGSVTLIEDFVEPGLAPL
jgi:nitrogenase molybdenum-iron protein beta chain